MKHKVEIEVVINVDAPDGTGSGEIMDMAKKKIKIEDGEITSLSVPTCGGLAMCWTE